jgi:flagellin-like hook-associated protein FlgL
MGFHQYREFLRCPGGQHDRIGVPLRGNGLFDDCIGFALHGDGPLRVEEVGDGDTAASLGLRGETQADTLTGRDVRPALAANTPLADIAALDGALPLGSIEMVVGGTATVIDFSAAATLGDLQSTFEAAMPGYQLRLDPSGLSIVSATTERFEVRDAGTPATASLLGLVGTGTPVRMFGVLEDLRRALENDDTDGIRGSLVELEALEQLVQDRLVVVGGRQRDLEWSEALLRQRETQLTARLSLERDADVARVSADLAQAETSYQSSLLVTSRLFQANLMMYL